MVFEVPLKIGLKFSPKIKCAACFCRPFGKEIWWYDFPRIFRSTPIVAHAMTTHDTPENVTKPTSPDQAHKAQNSWRPNGTFSNHGPLQMFFSLSASRKWTSGKCSEVYRTRVLWEKHLALVVDFWRNNRVDLRTAWHVDTNSMTHLIYFLGGLASLTEMQNDKPRVIVSNEFGKSFWWKRILSPTQLLVESTHLKKICWSICGSFPLVRVKTTKCLTFKTTTFPTIKLKSKHNWNPTTFWNSSRSFSFNMVPSGKLT